MEKKIKRIAANEILTDDNQILPLHVVEIEQGGVIDVYPLRGEQHSTIWITGRIELKRDYSGLLCAYFDNKRIE